MVLYPFLLFGLRDALVWPIPNSRASAVAILLLFGTGLLTLIDPVAAARTLAFCCGLCFLHVAMKDPRKRALILNLTAVHAWIVITQLALVMGGIEIDFSKLLRLVYGPLLPPTGIHIDYNAFSQIDLFIPRVAGLSREPAFASVLFLGMTFVAVRIKRYKLAILFTAATLCTLSKIVFPLILALALSWFAKRGLSRRIRSIAINFALVATIHLGVILAVAFFLEEVEVAMALDASFYHRFIGLYTFATQWDVIRWAGNSIDTISQADIFSTYEFLDDKRAFLDGSVISKIAVDFGYAALLLYFLLISILCARWPTIVATVVAGIFINLISVSPATILLFWLATGLYADALDPAEGRARKLMHQTGSPRPLLQVQGSL